ncbi:hypothetical protein TSUD_151450 [Trifolium subterraneum]|uniref:PPC domain-containing protein n=1 Tax=Trifolium subterraneum TaxID=3900 RepID=A0A2Z6MV07_TRISU|nr:hypothetical protein TSUD_151450 [Trifolium subterraneum]
MEGPFHMTSLFGTYINVNSDDVPPQFITNPPHSSFSICFTNNDGKIFGGIVGGRIIADDVVYVNAIITNGFDVVVAKIDTENDSD